MFVPPKLIELQSKSLLSSTGNKSRVNSLSYAVHDKANLVGTLDHHRISYPQTLIMSAAK